MLLCTCSCYRSHVMSEYGKNKKWRIRYSFALSKHSMIKMEQNSKRSDRVAEEQKSEGDYSTVYYCAMFYYCCPWHGWATVVSLFKGLAKGNESQHYAVCCFLRIMIFKVCRWKFSQQNGGFLR